MFSPDYFTKLDARYGLAFSQLEPALKDPNSDQSQQALREFVGKYMVPQKLWDLVSRENRYFRGIYPPDIHSLNHGQILIPIDSFFYKSSDVVKIFGKKYYDYKFNLDRDLNSDDVSFPNKYMHKRMEEYEEKIYSFIPPNVRQHHEEMKILYSKIKEAECDLDKWFEALTESNDVQFVRDNVEHELGKDLTNRNLWKKYINYLKQHDSKVLLLTYSKYCRFFTDDYEMIKEYREAAEKCMGPVYVPWQNPYYFEVYDDKFFDKEVEEFQRLERIQCKSKSKKKPLSIQFDFNTVRKQRFPFRLNTVLHILENANVDTLQKLFKSCKWFYASLPVNICHKFVNTRGYRIAKIKEQSIKSSRDCILPNNFDPLFISTVLDISSSNPNAISNLIPRLYHCTAKVVNISSQNLSLEDLQFVIGNAERLNLWNVKDRNGNVFKVETILQLIPRVKQLIIYPAEITSETSDKLCELQFQNKMERIGLVDLKVNVLDPKKFADFVKENCASKCYISLNFDFVNKDTAYVDRFRQTLDDAIVEKWEGTEKPHSFII